MDPTTWGPHAWFFLHTVTLNYSDTPTQPEKVAMASFFNSLGHILPCQICQRHYRRHLEYNPVEQALSSQKTLVKWLVNLHNEVNLTLGKPTITVPEAIANLNMKYNTPSKIGWRWFMEKSFGIYIIVGVILLVLMVIWKWKFSGQKYIRKYK
jgi:hypothetical protein